MALHGASWANKCSAWVTPLLPGAAGVWHKASMVAAVEVSLHYHNILVFLYLLSSFVASSCLLLHFDSLKFTLGVS